MVGALARSGPSMALESQNPWGARDLDLDAGALRLSTAYLKRLLDVVGAVFGDRPAVAFPCFGLRDHRSGEPGQSRLHATAERLSRRTVRHL